APGRSRAAAPRVERTAPSTTLSATRPEGAAYRLARDGRAVPCKRLHAERRIAAKAAGMVRERNGRRREHSGDSPKFGRRGAAVKPATIKDVAARAGVSVASVSRVLNDQGVVTDETRARVLEAVEALSYVPHSGARSLITRRTDTVGVILPDLFGEFFSELIRGMDRAAREKRLHLIVSSSHDNAQEASFAIRSMRGRVDGLIILSPHLDAAGLAANLPKSLSVLLMNG